MGEREHSASLLPTRRGRVVAAAVVALGGLTAWTAPGTAQAADTATVYVVQGLPETVVDVVIDGRAVATGLEAATISEPATLRPGTRTITVRSDGELLLERSIEVDAASSTDVVIHRPAAPTGDPVITTFDNDLSAVPADKAALTVAHTAAVPPADIVVDGEVLFSNVANGESLHVVVPARTYRVKIVPTGASGPAVLGPLDLTVEAGSLNRVFAVGRPSDDTMNVVVHVLGVPETGTSAPSRVNTGASGLLGWWSTGP